MSVIGNIIAVLSTIIVLEGAIFVVLNYTVGQIPVIKKIAYKDYLFLLVGLILIFCFVDFHLPY